MADYSPTCPTCGNKTNIEDMKVLDLVMSQRVSSAVNSQYDWLQGCEPGDMLSHLDLGVIAFVYETPKVRDEWNDDYLSGDGYLVFKIGDTFIRKDFSYSSYGTTTWSTSLPRIVQPTPRVVTSYEYE